MLMLWDAVCYFLHLLKGVPGADELMLNVLRCQLTY